MTVNELSAATAMFVANLPTPMMRLPDLMVQKHGLEETLLLADLDWIKWALLQVVTAQHHHFFKESISFKTKQTISSMETAHVTNWCSPNCGKTLKLKVLVAILKAQHISNSRNFR